MGAEAGRAATEALRWGRRRGGAHTGGGNETVNGGRNRGAKKVNEMGVLTR